VIEGDQLRRVEQIGFGKERIRTEALRDLLAPPGRGPTEVADVATAERRQIGGLLRLDGFERRAQCLERRSSALSGRERQAPRTVADSHIAVAPERSFEEEGVASGRLLLIEETEDAERRQQITGKLDGGRAAPKAGSAAGGCACERNCIRPRHVRAT
jgi:hypothetical protein